MEKDQPSQVVLKRYFGLSISSGLKLWQIIHGIKPESAKTVVLSPFAE
jgi:hypothetical protein